jgi:hypothetical protein
MNKTTYSLFFATINPLDVHPKVVVASFQGRWHTSIWELRDRTVIGRTETDSWDVQPTRYYLAR